jgi:pSer/pThr/pTyr-binding forkhead associated (FHA) protein
MEASSIASSEALMKDVTMISEKTPKYRRPVEKNEYSITCAIRKTPLVLTKTKKYTVGRLTKNNITLPQKTTSDLHATLKWDKNAFWVKDENSTNGTYVNDKRIDVPQALEDGDKIKIGKYVLQFHIKKIRVKKTV